eukprot:g1369.t1
MLKLYKYLSVLFYNTVKYYIFRVSSVEPTNLDLSFLAKEFESRASNPLYKPVAEKEGLFGTMARPTVVKGKTVVLGIGAYFAGVGAILHNSVDGGLPGLWSKFMGMGGLDEKRQSTGKMQDSHDPGHHGHTHHGHDHDSNDQRTVAQKNKDLADWRAQAIESQRWGSGVTDDERRKAFERGAQTYDDEIGTDELFMGLNLMRRALMRHSKGQVLEVAAGTGRNFDYYNLDNVMVTAVDSSEGMLRVAAKKVLSMDKSVRDRIACYVTCYGAELEFDDSSFDTVVDTFGLCSFEDPVESLREMKRSILKEADLDVEYATRWHFGTTHYVIATVPLDSEAKA